MGNQSSQWFALYYPTDTGKVIKRLRTSNLKHGHTWKLRKHIYSNTIFT